jgi:hypothetical protein
MSLCNKCGSSHHLSTECSVPDPCTRKCQDCGGEYLVVGEERMRKEFICSRCEEGDWP